MQSGNTTYIGNSILCSSTCSYTFGNTCTWEWINHNQHANTFLYHSISAQLVYLRSLFGGWMWFLLCYSMTRKLFLCFLLWRKQLLNHEMPWYHCYASSPRVDAWKHISVFCHRTKTSLYHSVVYRPWDCMQRFWCKLWCTAQSIVYLAYVTGKLCAKKLCIGLPVSID